MIAVSNDFKQAMKQPVKELDAYIKLDEDNKITSADDLISFKISCDSGMCKTAMRKLEAKYLGEHNLLGQWVHVGFGVKLPNGTFEYLDYGSFLVTEITSVKDTGVTTIVGYDKMVVTMKEYTKLEAEYPIKLLDYTRLLCETCGLELGNDSFGLNLYNYKDTVTVTSGVTADENGWITATYDNTNGTATKYLNYFTDNLNLKPSTNYNIIVEIKEFTGTGYLYFLSNYTDPNGNKYGQFVQYSGLDFDKMSNGMIYQVVRVTKSELTDVAQGLRSFVQYEAGKSGSITFRISVVEDTSITSEKFVYKPYNDMNDWEIIQELWENINGITYRDILVQIAQATGTTCIIGNDDKVYFKPLTETGEQLTYDNMLKLKLEPMYGEINSVVLARTPQEDNIYMRDEESIAEYGLTEWKIENNEIIDKDRDNAMIPIYNAMHGIAYYPFETTTEGLGWYEIADNFDIINDTGDTFNTTLFNFSITIDGGIKEILKTVADTKTQTQYQYATTIAKRVKNTEIIVDKALGEITSIVEEQSSQGSRISQVEQDINSITSKVEEVENDLGTKTSELQQTVDGLNLAVKRVGGNNLSRNSAMKNGTKFWLHSLQATYIESDTPPENPIEGLYWYCSSNYETYVLGTIYLYTNSEWVETNLTRKYLDNTNNLLQYTTSREDDESRKYTLSNSIIKLDGGNNLDVSHIFNVGDGVDIVEGEEFLTMSLKIKNSMKTGVGYIVLGFLNKYLEEIRNELVESIYEPSFLFTPDECKEWTNVVITAKIPKMSDIKPVVVSDIPPVDTTKLWLNTSYNLVMEYVDDNWAIRQSDKSVYDETTKIIYTYRGMFGGYYATSIEFNDNLEIKMAYPIITMYPGFYIEPSETEPTPSRNKYWLKPNDNAYRSKYDKDGNFIEWEDTGITTQHVLTNPYPVPPFPTEYGVPLMGYYEIADLKTEFNDTATAWCPHSSEIYGKNFKVDEKGLEISAGQNTMFIDEDEIVAKFNEQPIFQISGDMTWFKKMVLVESMKIGNFVQETRLINGTEYFLLY
jgi:hypothetical protein